jgi:hypothetical protein
MDSRKCQTATASPAEPGELPVGLDILLTLMEIWLATGSAAEIPPNCYGTLWQVTMLMAWLPAVPPLT